MSSEHGTPRERECACLSRRQTFRAAGAVGAAVAGVGMLSACGEGGQVGAAAGSVASAAGSAASQAIRAAEIPVGGGKVFESIQAVVTQPTAGEFKAFSSVCTHAGCQVGSVQDNVITCPCHGSQFDAATGAVKQGPASAPLPAKSVKVSGDGITVT
ncbi:Rieske (2Fe-2S) protein [Phycicoccus duodecadis]|uniref:Cytochrome bc1 complex Rieske iron-sulfur subunit n=1 Tax=Phycicoccus duodecadis TaxID=173053 RepID=A0A2N3YEG6_9MICO|nr:Rieske (2Fe-2S) protein [Phycicoccus duodecadis]PKW25238.1 nitrite reductase/ring-hydroxylating ferredoxin subunit [Phycicoccus duodecadis]